MNRSLLIVICDFTILSVLSMATFGPKNENLETTPRPSEDAIEAKSLQSEMFDQLKFSIEEERQLRAEELQRLAAEKAAREAELERERKAREDREAEMARVQSEKDLKLQRLAAEKAAREAELDKERQARELREAEMARVQSEKDLKLQRLAAEKSARELELLKARQLQEQKEKELQQQVRLSEERRRLLEEQKRLNLEKVEALKRAKESHASRESEWLNTSQRLASQEREARQRMQALELEKQKAHQKALEMKETLLSVKEDHQQKQDKVLEAMLEKEKQQRLLLVELQRKAEEAQKSKMQLEQTKRHLLEKEQNLRQQELKLLTMEHEKKLAQQEVQLLADTLEITQEQVKQTQHVKREIGQMVSKVQEELRDQNRSLEDSLQKVNRGQEALQEDLKERLASIKARSRHEIFKLAQDHRREVTVELAYDGLFGLKKEAKSFYGLELQDDRGESVLLFHYKRSPLQWSPLRGVHRTVLKDLKVLVDGRVLDSAVLEVSKSQPELLMLRLPPWLASSDSGEALGVSAHPRASEQAVFVDLDDLLYNKFPLQWGAANEMQVDADLGEQMFGPLRIKTGQYLFADSGRLLGVVLLDKTSLALENLETTESFSLEDSNRFNHQVEDRELWWAVVEPGRELKP